MMGLGLRARRVAHPTFFAFFFPYLFCVLLASPFSPLHPSLILFSLVMRLYSLCDGAISVAGKAVSISSDITTTLLALASGPAFVTFSTL